jgi:thiamine biosynthesis lipoprotein
MHRRDFLNPGQLARTAGQVAAVLEPVAPSEDSTEEIALLRVARRAMATTFEVVLPFGTPDGLAAAEAALDEIDRIEAQLTVYRETSEVTRLNQLAGRVSVPVEAGLFDLLAACAKLSAGTEGAFDITAGALIKAWGFYRGPRRVPTAEALAEARMLTGMHHVHLDAETHSVRFNCHGLEINLGSIGKGYALDRAAEILRRDWSISSGLLHGGHSSVYAIGTEPGSERGWMVGIRHPWDPERRLAVVRLRDQALGTSAATFQHLEHEGRKLGHLLDPRTGWPAEGMASASVIAPTAAEADALATAFFILGVEKAAAYCATHSSIGAVLLQDGTTDPVTIGMIT